MKYTVGGDEQMENKTRPAVQNRVGAPYGNPMGRIASEHGNRMDDREAGCRTRTEGHDGGTRYTTCRT